MYITAQQFLSIWSDKWWSVEDLSSYLSSAKTLVKKYWSALTNDEVTAVINKFDPSLSRFIALLASINKCNAKDIAQIQWLVGKNSEDWLWTIRSSHPDRVSSVKEGASVLQQETVGLTVQWAWKIYKRSLDRDVNKLLG